MSGLLLFRLKVAASASERNPTFLANAEYRDFLRVADCSQVSDGGAALLLVSEAGLEKLGRSPADTTEVLGLGHATGDLYDKHTRFLDKQKNTERSTLYACAAKLEPNLCVVQPVQI